MKKGGVPQGVAKGVINGCAGADLLLPLSDSAPSFSPSLIVKSILEWYIPLHFSRSWSMSSSSP